MTSARDDSSFLSCLLQYVCVCACVCVEKNARVCVCGLPATGKQDGALFRDDGKETEAIAISRVCVCGCNLSVARGASLSLADKFAYTENG